ncbi:glycosyltransferase [Photobacterium leiognathi]|uniref:glycosyltransferase n=1 Tax=Photobacterium leiognathi TaxID=553611 RepID=UPI002982490D|nr:glycosyltransferase [Photobacterium leiognathi]
MNKLVSVIITTYNREELLERAIISVINQTYENIEIIVSDDCSNYDIKSLLNNISKKYNKKIIYRCNETNSGACFTRNEAIKIANGHFIAGLDDDDEFTPNRISLFLENYSDHFSFIASNTTVITSHGQKKLFKSKNNRILSHEDCLWENLVGTQIFVEKEKIFECGCFDVNLSSAQDADMWIRLLKNYGSALRLKESTYLLHTEHDAPRISTSNKKIEGLRLFYKKHSSDMTNSQRKYARFKLNLWANNKLTLSSLFSLDLKSVLYILKRIIFSKK